MLKRIYIGLVCSAMLMLSAPAQAQSKATVDAVMAHIKQGSLILHGKATRQHSVRSHQNWAKGQAARRVHLSIADGLLSAFTALTTRKDLSKRELDSAMGYFKQAALIAAGKAVGRHSVTSHQRWAKTQNEATVRLSIGGHLGGLRVFVITGLK